MRKIYCLGIWFLLLLIFFQKRPVYGEVTDVAVQKELKERDKTEQKEKAEQREETEYTDSSEQIGYTEEELNQTTKGILKDLGLKEIDHTVEDMLGEDHLSFSQMIQELALGERTLDLEFLSELLSDVFIGELLEQKEIIMQLLLLILISALLMNMSHLFENGQLTNVTYYMIYLMTFALLMKSFRGLLGQVVGVLEGASSFLKVLTPAYFLAISAANGSMTASGYYELVLLTISLVQWILLNVGIPGIQMYVVLGIVNDLSSEDYLSKMAELVRNIVLWMTKTVTAVVVGLQVVQKMVSPALDLVKRGVIGKTAGAIPGIGNVIDSVTEMTVGCAILVRNCMGVAALIVLVLFGMGPVLQMAVTTLLYRLAAAIAQPLAERRMIKSITVMGEGCALLLRLLLTGEILFLLTIAIVAVGGIE